MPKFPLPAHQYRLTLGSHCCWNSKKHASSINEIVKQLACCPGRHSGNARQQGLALSMLQLLSLLSSLDNSYTHPGSQSQHSHPG